MIDLDRASLTEILSEMFVGATRRIVASLTLDECIRHRKDHIASALMEEIRPILAGEGTADDTSSTGWGVVLDTIEIQDVRVLSEEVFERLQAPFRERLALDALIAEESRMAAERKRKDEESAHAEELAVRRLEAELARARRKAEADRERAQVDLAAKREAADADAAILEVSRKAHVELSESRLREIMLTETMPELARAFRGTFDHVNITSTNADPFAFVSAGIDHVLAAVNHAKK